MRASRIHNTREKPADRRLKYDDRARGHVWCLALLVRSKSDEWRVYSGGTHERSRRRILRRRPTGADADKFLSRRWVFTDDRGFWVAGGDRRAADPVPAPKTTLGCSRRGRHGRARS